MNQAIIEIDILTNHAITTVCIVRSAVGVAGQGWARTIPYVKNFALVTYYRCIRQPLLTWKVTSVLAMHELEVLYVHRFCQFGLAISVGLKVIATSFSYGMLALCRRSQVHLHYGAHVDRSTRIGLTADRSASDLTVGV